MKKTIGIIAIILFLVILFSLNNKSGLRLGSAPSGLNASLAIATTTVVGSQENKTIFSLNPQCTSRVIGTAAQAILVIFGDPTNGDVSSTTLTGSIGFTQAASTTIMYDSGTYGCGRWSAYGYASSTITTTEFR